MRITTLPLIAGLLLALGACSGAAPSNPASGILASLSPFGPAQEVSLAGPAAPPGLVLRRSDARGLVDQVTGLSVEPTPGGAVIEAAGLPQLQGYWDAALVLAGASGGTLIYDLRVAPPSTVTAVGPPASREVVVAAYASDAALRDVRAIRVRGLRNALEVAR